MTYNEKQKAMAAKNSQMWLDKAEKAEHDGLEGKYLQYIQYAIAADERSK